MTQEEGNQNLKAERARNTELTGLFGYRGFKASATGLCDEVRELPLPWSPRDCKRPTACP